MGNIHEPPDNVYVLGYTWQSGSGSGGMMEVFIYKIPLEKRIEELLDEGRVKEGSIKVLALIESKWEAVKVNMPTKVEVIEP